MYDKKDKDVVHVMSSEEAWQVKKPRYNGWQCGHGKHKSKKDYNRNDKSWKDEEYQNVTVFYIWGIGAIADYWHGIIYCHFYLSNRDCCKNLA